jgi:Raf kinase inhibitor-like YbhB/YbcL family protein
MLKNIIAAIILTIASSASFANKFELSSPDLTKGKSIAETFVSNNFGCKGENVSPALNWKNAPDGTKSFAVIVHDPDARTGVGGFRHWIVVDIPANATGIAQGAGKMGADILVDGGRQIATDFGMPGWGGPCPPTGDAPHHYRFTVYALKVDKLGLPANASAGLAGFMVNMNAIGKIDLIVTYGR